MVIDRDSLLQLPCSFPIKVMGPASARFEQTIVEIVQRHAPALTPGTPADSGPGA